MARYPIDFDSAPSVNPGGAPNVRQQIDASPDMFGGTIARATSQLGQAIGHASEEGFQLIEQQSRMDATTHASELHSWQSEQVTTEQEKFLGLKGKAALEALPGFQQRIKDIQQQAKDQAGNPITAQMVDTAGRRLTDTSFSSASRHAASERRTWEARTAATSAQDAGNRAAFQATNSPVPNVNDDLTVQQQLGRSDYEVRNLAEAQGYDGPSIDAEVGKNRGKNVKGIVELLASDGSPTGVKRAFDFYKAQEEKIDAGSRVAIQNYLKGPLNQIAGARIGDEVLGRPPAPTPPEVVADVPSNFIGAIKNSEGFTGKAKWDYKQDSNGFGTKAKYPGEVIDVATATERFNTEISKAARIVDSVNPNLDPGTRAAMISLTFNAGSAWVDSGLGAKIRAGDVTGAKENFLQYNKAGGEVNSGLVTRRALEASWFGRGDISPTEVSRPRQNKGDVILRVMDDPDLQNRPQVQAAALAHINKIYQAWELQGAQDTAAFKLRLNASTAEALDTGQVKQPLGREEFITGMGPVAGEKAYADYQSNVQLGADMRSTASLPPDQIAALREKYKPVPGDSYLTQQARQEQLEKAIASNEKAKKADPASFLISRTDFGAESYKQFQTLMADKNATPQMRTAYAGMFADKMIEEQKRLGIPADQQRIVPQNYIDQLNAKLENPATAGGSLAVSQMIENEAKLWGDHWPEVYRQLSEKAQPAVRVIGSGVQSAAAQMLSELAPFSLADILKDQNTEKSATIKKDVLDAFKPLGQSLAGNDGATGLFNDFRGQAEKLAAKYVIGGMTSSEASTKAFNDLVGFKYTFQNGYRVPKDSGVDPDTVARGSVVALRDLGKLGVKAATDNVGGVSADYLMEGKIKSLQRDGKWVTSPDEKGLMLVHNDQAVRRPDGAAFTLTWKQLNDLAVPDQRRRDQQFDRFNRLGTFG